MAFSINFSEEKNQLLKATRGVSFHDVVLVIKNSKLLDDINHPSHKKTHQKIYVVEIDSYAYAVPYVINKQKNEIFLKTIYPSRVFTKKYLGKEKNE